MGKDFNKIRNPSVEKLSGILIIIPIMAILCLIFKIPLLWLWIIGGILVGLFMIFLTIFCIKQKCYRQLVFYYIAVVMMFLILYLQHNIKIS